MSLLNVAEVTELLAFVKERRAPGWVYPMLACAAHTGMRRSELIRAKGEDVDIANGVVTVREKKRQRGTRTTRRVPLSTLLTEMLGPWLAGRPGKPFLFGLDQKPLAVQTVQKAIVSVLKGSKWSVLKGWHVMRHSFISALASRGVDQRMIDEFVGHQSDEQRRRYRHLYPSTQAEAIRLVFG